MTETIRFAPANIEGAVGMVELELLPLEGLEIGSSKECEAAMMSNFLVVLCGGHPALPVVKVATLDS